MTSLVSDRVQENSTLAGTGPVTLAGATTPAMNTFASAFADGALCGYVVLNLATLTEWEQGIGTYAAGTNTIARTYVTAGSNGTSPVNFSAGAKMVISVAPAPSSGDTYSATRVYAPGDTAQYSSTTWYALAVSKGSTPATGNANWTAMGGGGGGGSGTVTSVGMTVPAWLSVGGSPVTTAGTLAVSAKTAQAAMQFLATPNGTTGPVGLRAIVASDIPTLNQSTTGNAATATALAAAPTISGVAFNGTTNITIPFSGLGGKPTTLSGYGITDAATAAQGAKADSAVQSVVAGANVTVDNTDPQNPVVSATGGSGSSVIWNPNDCSTQAILCNSSTIICPAPGSASGARLVRATQSFSSGKHYFELKVNVLGASNFGSLGLVPASASLEASVGVGGWSYNEQTGTKTDHGTNTTFSTAWQQGDVLGVAFDLDAGMLWFAKNNTWQASGDPSAGTNPAFSNLSGTLFPAVAVYGGNGGTFQGVFKAALFKYAPPTGFAAVGS